VRIAADQFTLMFVRAQNAGPASGLGLPMREPSVVSCVPLAPRITCSLLTVIATKHSFDFGNREWLVATRERPVDYRPSQNDGVYATVKRRTNQTY